MLLFIQEEIDFLAMLIKCIVHVYSHWTISNAQMQVITGRKQVIATTEQRAYDTFNE